MIGLLFQPAANRAQQARTPPGTAWGADRNDVGDIMLRLTPPTSTTFIISIILAVVAVAGQYIHQISNYVPISMFWLAVIAYIVLFFGNLIRGL
jgi:hypothetical protein